jgi:hypothetical protein
LGESLQQARGGGGFLLKKSRGQQEQASAAAEPERLKGSREVLEICAHGRDVGFKPACAIPDETSAPGIQRDMSPGLLVEDIAEILAGTPGGG